MATAQSTPVQQPHDGDPRAAKEKKLQALKDAGINPYPHVFPRTHRAGEVQEKYEGLENGQETTKRLLRGVIFIIRS